MHHALEALELGIIVLDAMGRIELCNRWVSERARLSDTVVGLDLAEAFGTAIDPRLLQATVEALARGRSSRLSHAFHPMPLPLFALRGPTTERIHQAVDVLAVSRGEGRQCVLQIRDMSETLRRESMLKQQSLQLAEELARLRQTQDELARQSLRFKEMARLAPVGLFETDMQGRLTYCNDRGLEMLGLDGPQDLGRNWTHALSAAAADALHQRWIAATESATRLNEEFHIARPGQEERWLRLEAGPIRDSAQAPVGFICTLMDVTDLQQRAQHHEYRANHDPLTGLPNRARFEQRLHAALAGAQRLDSHLAVVYLDLDGFKLINDQYGHAAGDVILQTVASRLRKHLRGDDMVARLGGDEFALLLLEAPDEPDLDQLLGKLSKTIHMPINLPTPEANVRVHVGCSMGRALFPEHGQTLEDLLAHADRAMYEQKSAHKRAEV